MRAQRGNSMKIILLMFLINVILFSPDTHGFFGQPFRGEYPDAKSARMGFVGATLMETKTTLYSNPALLGLKSSIGIEEITAAFESDDDLLTTPYYLQNGYTFTTYLKNIKTGISANVNYSLINGSNEYYDNPVNGEYWISYDNNYNLRFNIGLGRLLYRNECMIHSLGADVTMMYRHEANDIGWQYGFDIGYLFKHKTGFGTSLCINNMGNNFNFDFGNDLIYEIPIPFNIDIAIGYEKQFYKNSLLLVKTNTECSYKQFIMHQNSVSDSEWVASPFYEAIVKSNTLKEDGEFHFGIDICVLNTLSFGNGYILGYNYTHEKYKFQEILYGFGINILNHISADFAFNLYRIETYKSGHDYKPNVPFRMSFSITNIFDWEKSDLKWWLKQ
jgi:hypothetical protein